jgi:hypothetical protein
MKTTVEVPDILYRQIKARAALEGQSIKVFFLEALSEKLGMAVRTEEEEIGWRAAFGKGDKEAVAEVQRIIDADHKIDYSGWGFTEAEIRRMKEK